APGRLPLPVAMALVLPRVPLVVAPLLALWWLAHFGFVTALLSVAPGPRELIVSGQYVHLLLFKIAEFGYNLASNGYLFLAVGAFTRRLVVLRWLWRVRGLIDLALVLTSTLIAGLRALEVI